MGTRNCIDVKRKEVDGGLIVVATWLITYMGHNPSTHDDDLPCEKREYVVSAAADENTNIESWTVQIAGIEAAVKLAEEAVRKHKANAVPTPSKADLILAAMGFK